jgi:hypothetical protein
MEVLPFVGAQRSQWIVSDRWKFFCDLEPIFGKNLSIEDKCEIKLRLKENDPDFFEIPIYSKSNNDEPSVIVIFEQDKVFVDFIDPKKKEFYLKKIQNLVGNEVQITNWRDLTQKDWITRLGVLEVENLLETL